MDVKELNRLAKSIFLPTRVGSVQKTATLRLLHLNRGKPTPFYDISRRYGRTRAEAHLLLLNIKDLLELKAIEEAMHEGHRSFKLTKEFTDMVTVQQQLYNERNKKEPT
jgi:hypothetical protein